MSATFIFILILSYNQSIMNKLWLINSVTRKEDIVHTFLLNYVQIWWIYSIKLVYPKMWILWKRIYHFQFFCTNNYFRRNYTREKKIFMIKFYLEVGNCMYFYISSIPNWNPPPLNRNFREEGGGFRDEILLVKNVHAKCTSFSKTQYTFFSARRNIFSS